MGEIWRARDAKLGREVAIKTLPEEFAKDMESGTQLGHYTTIPSPKWLDFV